MTCDNCGRPCDADALACPYCRTSVTGGFARLAETDRLDRTITESLLARCDLGVEDLLTRDFGGPLALDELRGAVARIDRSDPSVVELERSLSREASAVLDGIALSELIDARGADIKVIRRGLVFLKNRRWAEALEWWSLHHPPPGAADERRRLLLLLLEAFTHRLANDRRRAAEVHARITEHPLYRAARGMART